MDPSMDLQTTTDPAAHVAYTANPTPSHETNLSYPPYAEMIIAAIVALKEKNGSSGTAIAKYIDQEYWNLNLPAPPTHLALLTHHLNRLTETGHLLMLNHSYTLPGSLSNPTTDATLSSPGPKRRPGRPPKPKPDLQVQPNGVVGPQSILDSIGLGDGPPTTIAKRGRGRPPKVKTGPEVQPNGGLGSESMLVSLGLVDELPIAVQPNGVVGSESMLASLGLNDEPPNTVAKTGRGRGRPPKVKTGSGVAESGRPSFVKRGRGRPLKVKTGPGMAKSGGPSLGKRSRGRPPKPKLFSGPMGWPKRGPGRPPRTGPTSVPGSENVGKPRGRPRKGAYSKKNASSTAIQVSESQQLMAYHDLQTKLQHFQSRVQQAVSVVKPYLNIVTAASAVVALQELEELATMDVSAPLN